MVLDIAAWLILGFVYIFGGAAFFDSNRTEYKNVLAGWTVLNAVAVVVTLMFSAAFWALARLLA